MDDFPKIERTFKRTPVRLPDHKDASGVLRLRGKKSRLEVSSGSFVHFKPLDDNGWYDLKVRAADGREMLLHHALTIGMGSHHGSSVAGEAHVLSVFPNIVVDDVRGLSDDGRVHRVRFRLKGLHEFFDYQFAEQLSGRSASPAQIEALRGLRYTPDREEGPFNPEEIYVIHGFPSLLQFRVEDRTYRVWLGGRFSGGSWHRVDAITYPVAEILFDEPMNIEAALDRVWEWRRFFVQMAMDQVPIEGISIQGSLDDRAPSANLYLPNLKQRAPHGRHPLRSRHLALTSWADRERLQEAMRTWLQKGEERRTFRARLDRVINRMNRRSDPADLVELSSAVDGLSELAPLASLPEGVLDAMADAASAAAESAGAQVPRERLQGLLGSVQRPSLSSRFTGLSKGCRPPLRSAEIAALSGSATRIRNASAHGGAMTDQIQPRVWPTVESLAALCARFDLETCGFPSKAPRGLRTMSKVRLDEALAALKELDDSSPKS